jgi:hypothetical protein
MGDFARVSLVLGKGFSGHGLKRVPSQALYSTTQQDPNSSLLAKAVEERIERACLTLTSVINGKYAIRPGSYYSQVEQGRRGLYSLTSMYRDFQASDRWTKKQVHCLYQALVVAVATRHADAVDIKFLVDGRPVWVVLPLVAWDEYKKRTGKRITDPLAIQIAGRFLKYALESGEGGGREMYSLTVDQTLQHLDAVVNQAEPAAAG